MLRQGWFACRQLVAPMVRTRQPSTPIAVRNRDTAERWSPSTATTQFAVSGSNPSSVICARLSRRLTSMESSVSTHSSASARARRTLTPSLVENRLSTAVSGPASPTCRPEGNRSRSTSPPGVHSAGGSGARTGADSGRCEPVSDPSVFFAHPGATAKRCRASNNVCSGGIHERDLPHRTIPDAPILSDKTVVRWCTLRPTTTDRESTSPGRLKRGRRRRTSCIR